MGEYTFSTEGFEFQVVTLEPHDYRRSLGPLDCLSGPAGII